MMKPEKILYTARATATGGREGHVQTEDGVVSLPLAIPSSMGGPGGAKANPEMLFACGYAACFGSAVEFVARQEKLKVGPVKVHSEVGIGLTGSAFALTVKLRVEVPGATREQAEAIVQKAHYVCPYSNATRGNIEVLIEVE